MRTIYEERNTDNTKNRGCSILGLVTGFQRRSSLFHHTRSNVRESKFLCLAVPQLWTRATDKIAKAKCSRRINAQWTFREITQREIVPENWRIVVRDMPEFISLRNGDLNTSKTIRAITIVIERFSYFAFLFTSVYVLVFLGWTKHYRKAANEIYILYLSLTGYLYARSFPNLKHFDRNTWNVNRVFGRRHFSQQRYNFIGFISRLAIRRSSVMFNIRSRLNCNHRELYSDLFLR